MMEGQRLKLIANYSGSEELHDGPSSIIYKAYRDSDHALVVIKIAKREYPTQREIAKLRHEYAILKDLELPGVPRAHAIEPYMAGVALIREYVPGRSLSQVLRTQKLDLPAILRIAAEVAGILGAIHRHGVLHRDIKPHNIVLGPTLEDVHLIDFGIATRLSQQSQKITSPDALEGTLGYMSPEQTGRMNRTVDHRTDFYSLGVTLYEMLTNRLPFVGSDPMDLVHGHIALVPPAPCEVDPAIPRVLSDLVMKLMAKAAEDRYQSASGLQADLLESLRQWEAQGQIEPFALGRLDHASTLQIIQKLYGRRPELDTLLEAFSRVGRGSAELVLVSGYSGVGKSSLVYEIHKPIARRGGYFASGKFDQYDRALPYTAIAHAFRELCRQILTERADALARWKDQTLGAVGNNGRLLVDLIPELELIIGPQSAAPPLGPAESQNRFNLVLQNFLRVVATAEHPLVLFLDDLQWADPASLRLLHLVMTDPERGHLLIVGAYRDNEVGAGHVLALTLDELRKSGAVPGEIQLKPLGEQDVVALVADTVGAAPARAAGLAHLVFGKTHGNPFFVNQLLRMFQEEGLLRFDARAGEWQWVLAEIQGHQVTDNVVDLLEGRIRRLSVEGQRIVRLCACIGHQFDWGTLSTVAERPHEQTAAALWEALSEGLLLPTDSEYRFVHSADPPALGHFDFKVSYRFLHDRVQQAAYSLIPESDRASVHLRIGRLLRDQGQGAGNDALFEVVNHLNRGVAVMDEQAERLGLAAMNLRAGERAKAATAYQAASDYFRAGMFLLEGGLEGGLDGGGWDTEYTLTFSLCVGLTECEYLSGRFDAAEPLFEILLARSRSRLDRAHVYHLRMVLDATLGKSAEVIATGRAALSMFGVVFPDDPAEQQAAVVAELAKVDAARAGRSMEELLDSPVVTDPDHVALMQLLASMSASAFFTSNLLFALTVLEMVKLSLRLGYMAGSDYAYTVYGIILVGSLGNFRGAYEFGLLGVKLNGRFGAADWKCMADFIFGGIVMFREPLRAGVPYFEGTVRSGLECGNFTYASYGCLQLSNVLFSMGEPLETVDGEIGKMLALLRRTQDTISTAIVTVNQQAVRALLGQTRGSTSLSDDTFDEERFSAEIDGNGFVQWFFALRKLELHCIGEDHSAALQMADRALALHRAGVGIGHFLTPELFFYTCLTLTALHLGGSAEERERFTARLTEAQAQLRQWADANPEAFRHEQLLVEAEVARVSDREADAVGLYEQAIVAAQRNGRVQHAALAAELCARFHVSRGRRALAGFYMKEAHHGYLRWGAATKAQLLMQHHADLLEEPAGTAEPLLTTATVTTSSGRISGRQLDMAMAFRAAQAIAGEIELDKVLDQLMRIVMATAGAQRGFLLVPQAERWVIAATMSTKPETLVRTGLDLPLETCADLAATVVNYTIRTREVVLLGDAGGEPRFAGDPYIADSKPKSILCLALLHQGRRSGVLYLENNAARDAFTKEIVEVLRLLSSQAAIAIENAHLYEDVQRARATLRRANEELEQQVDQRTEELHAATAQLRSANESLTQRTEELRGSNERLQAELIERERTEQARAALQEEVIRAQNERLEEMSTPLIPITDDIVVMPLIGTVDRPRAEQVLVTALTGAAHRKARIVILDITGMRHIDESVAATLLNTANALRMLGAQAVLTGIRPELAQMLVTLNIDLGSLVTRGTLQGGIAYAIQRAGFKDQARSL